MEPTAITPNRLAPLTPRERRAFRADTVAIRRYLRDAERYQIMAGERLIVVRNQYLRRNYDKFLSYCRRELGISGTYASYLIAAARSFSTLHKCEVRPVNAGQVRPLAGLPAEEQVACWEESVQRAEGLPPPERVVRQVVRERLERANPAEMFDSVVRMRKIIEEIVFACKELFDGLARTSWRSGLSSEDKERLRKPTQRCLRAFQKLSMRLS